MYTFKKAHLDEMGKWNLFRELMVFGRAQMSLKVMSEYPHYIFLSICLLSTYTLLYSTLQYSHLSILFYISYSECVYTYTYTYTYIYM